MDKMDKLQSIMLKLMLYKNKNLFLIVIYNIVLYTYVK